MCWLLALAGTARAQTAPLEVHDNERLAGDRPEAWAMHYMDSATLMTSFGAAPALDSGQWNVAIDLGHIPSLGVAQRRVGFNGTKSEDLNKTPVFGRLRLALGLPGNWLAEVGVTPPLEIDGARPRHLVAAALGRRVYIRSDFSASARVFGQNGSVEGDFTCPRQVAGPPDALRNPYGCHAPSRDRVRLDHYGIDLTVDWQRADWNWHATAGAVRHETQVQVDALTFGVHDLTRLVARDTTPYFSTGLRRRLGPHWSAAVELLHAPLPVRRSEGAARESDPLTSLRLQVRYGGL